MILSEAIALAQVKRKSIDHAACKNRLVQHRDAQIHSNKESAREISIVGKLRMKDGPGGIESGPHRYEK